MKVGDVFVVNMLMDKAWTPSAYLARIVECEDDGIGNWAITKCRVFGETFDRDIPLEEIGPIKGYRRIPPEDKQAAALQIASKQWGVFAYKDYDAVRAAILEIAP